MYCRPSAGANETELEWQSRSTTGRADRDGASRRGPSGTRRTCPPTRSRAAANVLKGKERKPGRDLIGTGSGCTCRRHGVLDEQGVSSRLFVVSPVSRAFLEQDATTANEVLFAGTCARVWFVEAASQPVECGSPAIAGPSIGMPRLHRRPKPALVQAIRCTKRDAPSRQEGCRKGSGMSVAPSQIRLLSNHELGTSIMVSTRSPAT